MNSIKGSLVNLKLLYSPSGDFNHHSMGRSSYWTNETRTQGKKQELINKSTFNYSKDNI